MQPRRILVVADERTSDWICRTLKQRGLAVTATAAEDGDQKLKEPAFDLIVVELKTPEAAIFIKQVRNSFRAHETPLLAIGEWGTGQPTLALSSGADAYEPTPIDATRLADAVERILNQRVAVVGMSE